MNKKILEKKQKNSKFKIVLVGNVFSGKSSMLARYMDDVFIPNIAYYGVNFRQKSIMKDEKKFDLSVWDYTGNQGYHQIILNFVKDSNAVCVVFDITNLCSLKDCQYWFQKLIQLLGDQILYVLIGNKSDLLSLKTDSQNHISQIHNSIKRLEEQFKAKYFITSCLTGQNVGKVFDYIFEQLYERSRLEPINKNQQDFPVKLGESKEQRNSRKCFS